MSVPNRQLWVRASLITAGAAFGLVWISSLPTVSDAAEAEVLTILDYKLLPEASGLAVSRRTKDRLWLLNDSGNRAELVALDLKDSDFSRVKLRSIANRDWEDLESFTYQGEAWLAIADVGDNAAARKDVEIYLLPEPGLKKNKVSVHTTIKVSYPDGSRDVESLAIDSTSQAIYLLSKRDPLPHLYRVPLPDLIEGKSYLIVAESLGVLGSIPPPSAADLRQFPRYGQFRSQPTAMTMSPDGSTIAVMTYGGAYLAALGPDGDWLAALNGNLCAVETPELAQGETIAVDSLGRLYVTTEGKGAKLYRLAAQCVE